MALQRTFSGFPSGCPGFALLLLRLGVAGRGSLQAVLLIATMHHVTAVTLAAVLAIISSLSLAIGFLTPIATTFLCLGGLAGMIGSEIAGLPWAGEFAVADLEFIVMSAVLFCLGPGAYSLDARLYGRREIDLNGDSA